MQFLKGKTRKFTTEEDWGNYLNILELFPAKTNQINWLVLTRKIFLTNTIPNERFLKRIS